MSFILTDENYYSREADIHYMSCSQYQGFLKCEAAQIAKLCGEFVPEKEPDALFQGQYFHAALEGDEAFRAFCEAPEHFGKIFKVKTTKARGEEITGKYAPFEKLDEMLAIARREWEFLLELEGENEKFLTGEIFGMPWRMKMDKYIPGDRWIIDYKTSANLYETFYNPQTKRREDIFEHYGYLMRAAVYCEIERQYAKAENYAPFIIAAITKQDPPNFDVFLLENINDRFALELETVKSHLARIQRLKLGFDSPRRCGDCEYCRSTKHVNSIRSYKELIPEFREDIENAEYDDYGGEGVLDTLSA